MKNENTQIIDVSRANPLPNNRETFASEAAELLSIAPALAEGNAKAMMMSRTTPVTDTTQKTPAVPTPSSKLPPKNDPTVAPDAKPRVTRTDTRFDLS